MLRKFLAALRGDVLLVLQLERDAAMGVFVEVKNKLEALGDKLENAKADSRLVIDERTKLLKNLENEHDVVKNSLLKLKQLL